MVQSFDLNAEKAYFLRWGGLEIEENFLGLLTS